MHAREDGELRRASVRLSVEFTGLIVVLLGLVACLAFVIVSASQSEASQRSFVESARIDSVNEAPAGVLMAIYSNGRWQLSRDLPPGLPDLAAARAATRTGTAQETSLTVDGHLFSIRTATNGARITQVVISQQENQEELKRLTVALVVSGLLAAIAAGFAATLLARRAMRPMADALALQRRFVADASHELRTPLTLLSTRAQMLRRRLPGGAGWRGGRRDLGRHRRNRGGFTGPVGDSGGPPHRGRSP
jgi:two-component system OmpR family sensor kinase